MIEEKEKIVYVHEGNLQKAVAHIITGVIGAGVLSLAWSVAQLGWIGGPFIILVFAGTTFVSSNLLSDCYTFSHPQHGNIRCSSLIDAVHFYQGYCTCLVSFIFII